MQVLIALISRQPGERRTGIMKKRLILIKMANYDIEKLFENYCKYYCQVDSDKQFAHMVKWRDKINEVVEFLKEELGDDLFTNTQDYDYNEETLEFINNIRSVHEIVNRS
jgi:hypothetical protein